jgi:exopolysaccharide biosynthesis polyprenyl glycosylphosphotransferase
MTGSQANSSFAIITAKSARDAFFLYFEPIDHALSKLLFYFGRRRPIRAALLGDVPHVNRVIALMNSPNVDLVIKGLIIPQGQTTEGLSNSVRILGTTGQLAELINREHLNRIIVVSGSISDGELDEYNKVFKRMGVIVNCTVPFAPEWDDVNVVKRYGLRMVEFRPLAYTRTEEVVKRAFDIVASAIALIFLAPIMLVIAALVKFTSEGPVLYIAPRVGRGGRHFRFLKFRTMYTAADRAHVAHANEKLGHIFMIKKDPRITPIGQFLRRHSLDELPQLINVLRGEMSLVGPRPLPASDLGPDGLSREFADWSEGRSAVYPGITGLWQVNGRSELPFEEMVRLDLQYIREWSLLLDLKILVQSLVAIRQVANHPS